MATSEVDLTAAGVEDETGAGALYATGVELELEASTLTASTGAAATEVEAGATGVEEVEKVVELEGSLVDGIAVLQMEGGYSSMPSVMVETGVPN